MEKNKIIRKSIISLISKGIVNIEFVLRNAAARNSAIELRQNDGIALGKELELGEKILIEVDDSAASNTTVFGRVPVISLDNRTDNFVYLEKLLGHSGIEFRCTERLHHKVQDLVESSFEAWDGQHTSRQRALEVAILVVPEVIDRASEILCRRIEIVTPEFEQPRRWIVVNNPVIAIAGHAVPVAQVDLECVIPQEPLDIDDLLDGSGK